MKEDAAIKTLENLGYTYHGGELWKPPLGQAPDFDLIDSLRERLESLEKTKESLCKALDDAGDSLIEAGAKIESLEKDSARYRWLRDIGLGEEWVIESPSGCCTQEHDYGSLDVAIDTAMQANKGE